MKTILLFLSIFTFLVVKSQHQVGHYTITFQDPERGNRNIETEIYYPAVTAGNNTQVAAGEFPVIVFGHGFVMAWSAYQNLWDEFVPRGYIMVFPRTEGSIFGTDHQEFGWDLEYLVTQMQAEGLNASSPVFNAVDANTALMGHSMGGGASFLAADSLCTSGNTNLKTLVGLAPAESSTNGVSSINSALSVTVPSVILSGSQDGVTPPVDHHIPMYDNLASDCKTFINVLGGAHCYFANTNTACDFGEGTSSSGIAISRTEQHQVTFDFLNLWFDYTLKSDCEDFGTFQDSLNNSNRITYNQSCNYQPLSVSSSVNHPACNGMNGNATLSITGGEPAYAEDWGSASSNALPAGTHNYTVTDAGGCSVSGSVVITEPDPLVVVESVTDPSCNGLSDGSVSLAISGGAPGYNEIWGSTNPNSLGAGNYSYTVEDANACSYSNTVVVTEPSGITVTETLNEPTCFGDNDGSVVLNISGGAGGYSENWNGVNPSSLTAGNYSVTVTDGNGCSVVNSMTLGQPSPMGVSGTVTDVSCFGLSDGNVSLVISGGTLGYSEDWGVFLSGELPAGTHAVTITDAAGCESIENFSVGEPTELIVNANVTNPTCFGISNGSVSLSISGGTPSYVENWGGLNPSALPAGTHNVIVTDAAGCQEPLTVTLNEPTEIVAVATTQNPSCFASNDGSVSLNISGGVPTYTEDWGVNDPNALMAGTYSVQISDANGCDVTSQVTLTEPSAIEVSDIVSKPSCFGDENGMVELTISGGTPAYTENWNGFDPMNVGAGNYSVVVTDANGCTEAHNVTVTEPSALSVTLNVIDEVNGSDGEINVLAAGGTPGYSYAIDGGASTSNNVFTGLDDGFYTLTIQDANGCTIMDTTSIDAPSSVGLAETFLAGVKIYPVPLGENLFIEFGDNLDGNQSVSVMLSNVLGEVVLDRKVDASKDAEIIDVSLLTKGTYLLTIKGDKFVRSFKVVK